MSVNEQTNSGFIHFELSRKILLQVTVALFIIATISLSSYSFLKKLLVSTEVMTEHTVNLTLIQDLEVLLARLETGQKSYLISGDEKYLSQFESWLQKAYSTLKNLQVNSRNSDLETSLKTLDVAVEARISLLQQSVQLRKRSGFEAARSFYLTDKGNEASAVMQNLLNDIQKRETFFVDKAINDLREEQRVSLLLVLAGSLVAFILIVIAALRINSDLVKVKNINQDVPPAEAPAPKRRRARKA